MDRNRSLCRKWDKLGSCRTDTPFVLSEINPKKRGGVISSPDMFDFMVLTCQETCSLCGDAGCVDEHPNCVQWVREGGCFKNPEFMGHTCRESCGTCGFLSSDSREEQEVEGRAYSDSTRSNFHCGEYKQLCEVNGENCDEVEDTPPTPSSTTPPVTQPLIDVDK